MINKLYTYLIIIGLVVAIVIGLIYRQTYTNLTEEQDFMEKYFSVALLNENIVSDSLIETMRNDLPKSNLIIRVSSQGETNYSFKSYKQYATVEEIYKGNGLEAGERIAVTSSSWLLFFDDMTANLNFVNFMQPNQEYLLFLDERVTTLDPNEKEKVYVFSDFIVPGIFNYDNQENNIIKVSEDDIYVPYSKVRNNEFFISSEEILNNLLELKYDLIEQFPR